MDTLVEEHSAIERLKDKQIDLMAYEPDTFVSQVDIDNSNPEEMFKGQRQEIVER